VRRTQSLRRRNPRKVVPKAQQCVRRIDAAQTPDFRAYEAALLDGRTVVGVRIDAGHLPVARDALLASGLHFLNFFGRWSTTEVSPWRGPELDLPDYLRR